MKSKTTNPYSVLKLSNPVYAYLELTYDCPGQCPGCPALGAPDRTALLPGSRWENIIRYFSTFLEEVRLTGGEPTLHPDFLEILLALEKSELPYRIYTSGHWPDAERLLASLKDSRFFRGFNFSLHGSTAQIHEIFTGPVDFERVLSHITGAVKCGFPVHTSSIIGLFNHGDLFNIMLLSSRLGAGRHFFRRYIGPIRDKISFYREYQNPLLEVLEKIPPRIFSYRIGECFPKCFFRGGTPCLAGITHITLTPSAQIKACPFSSEIPGSLDEKNRITGKRKIATWAADINDSCLGCDEIGACLGGCRTMRRDYYLKRDPLMELPLQYGMNPEPLPEETPIMMNGRLKMTCSIRKEKFGHILMKEGNIVPVTAMAQRALALCDGTRTVGDLERIAGPEGRDFILSLYVKGFLTLV